MTSRIRELRPNSHAQLAEAARRSGPTADWSRQAVERAKAGDTEGLHFLYVRYAPDVQRYVNSFVHDHHEAEDITQNIFAKLMKAINKYEQREVPFAAWIMRVARNAALDHCAPGARSRPRRCGSPTTARPRSASTAAATCGTPSSSCPRISARC